MGGIVPSVECCLAARLREIVVRYGMAGEDRDVVLNAANTLSHQNNCPPHLPDFYRGSRICTGKTNTPTDAPQGRVE